MAKLRNPTSSSITLNGDDTATLIQCEVIGAIRVHAFLKDGEEDESRGYSITPLNCDKKAGTFKNITTARRIAKAVQLVPGTNWEGLDVDAIAPTPEIKRAVLDIIKPHHLS